jgi:hypothetical protein
MSPTIRDRKLNQQTLAMARVFPQTASTTLADFFLGVRSRIPKSVFQ